jgi:two-component system NtrC family sensor kinase
MTALGGMLSGVAHELNNPLCSVLGYAQLLRQAEVDARTRKGIEVILRETERASRIVANLLRFARREPPEPRAADVNALLKSALERKAPDLRICGIRVETDLDPGLPRILGDTRQLTTAFTNLITNAQQAMFEHRGEGVLRVATAARGAVVSVSVADDGPGIASEHLRRVFDPFFTTKAVGQGTGLGLSVAFAIVRDHGGTIRVQPGKTAGVTFVLDLPIPSPEALSAAGDAKDAARPPAAGGQAPETGPRVLVAASDPGTTGLAAGILRSMGYLAATAGDRSAVLAALDEGEFEALIADAEIPDLDGRRLLEALRARHPLLARRVIFLVPDARDPGAIAFASSSGNMLVGKPPDPPTLRAALRRLVASTLVDEAPIGRN